MSTESGPYLYTKRTPTATIYLLVYVDGEESEMFQSLQQEFHMTCLGKVRHFLGLEVEYDGSRYRIRRGTYIDYLINKHDMADTKSARCPMDVGYLKAEDT